MRLCEICSDNNLLKLHRQHFIFSNLVEPVHYDVVACQSCGFTFANDIPNQSSLNNFYQESEHHLHTALPSGLEKIHRDFFDFIRSQLLLSEQTKILDIGSGMGHFLQHFKAAGFTSLLGMEPSPAAVQLAQQFYGLDIRSATVDTFDSHDAFELITLCGVLEHIADLRESIRKISTLLHQDGHLFIAVPDVVSFGTTPPAEAFLEFAVEHINFFSTVSLRNLMAREGFVQIAIDSHYNDFYGNHYLLGLYRKKTETQTEIKIDAKASTSIKAYIDLSKQKLQQAIQEIEILVSTQEPVIIWGAGALTSRLLCDTNLSDANIQYIVDRNKDLHGKILNGLSIEAPEIIKDKNGLTIFIASTTYATEIKKELEKQYGWTGKIVTVHT
jgi:2-polyprenyl-3-methyl-5-hydroxy-6-metoxy-1,4-benzoquinol methylase